MDDDPIAAIERAANGKYWQLAKGKVRIGEPLFGAAVLEPETDKVISIGEGHSLMQAIANLKPATEK